VGALDDFAEAHALGPAHLSYTYRSDDSTKTRRLTTVVARLPESIGFVAAAVPPTARL
jgi:hypothetical protein